MSSYLSTNIDFALLREQKIHLLELHESPNPPTPAQAEAIMGIVHLIDHVQDFSVDHEGLRRALVFGPDAEQDDELPARATAGPAIDFHE